MTKLKRNVGKRSGMREVEWRKAIRNKVGRRKKILPRARCLVQSTSGVFGGQHMTEGAKSARW